MRERLLGCGDVWEVGGARMNECAQSLATG